MTRRATTNMRYWLAAVFLAALVGLRFAPFSRQPVPPAAPVSTAPDAAAGGAGKR